MITDRDARWKGEFWKEICKKMMIRSLTTAYHPQADGQTEVLNQSLEISLHAYVGPSRNDWVNYLDALALSYNTTSHGHRIRSHIFTKRIYSDYRIHLSAPP